MRRFGNPGSSHDVKPAVHISLTLRLRSADSTLPHLGPTGSSWVSPSITARYFSAGPSDSTLRWTPCPPENSKQWLQVGLGCDQLLSLSCPFRPFHTFCLLRPARLRTPLLGYGAPHSGARGASTLLNNALLSAHFRLADNTSGRWGCVTISRFD